MDPGGLTSRRPGPPGDGAPPHGHRPLVAVVGLLVVSNVMSNEVLPHWAYLPWNVAVTVVLLWLALRVDRTPAATIGLDRAMLPRGLAAGGVVVAVVAVVLISAALVPATRDLFDDSRVGEVGAPGMIYQVAVRIPFGTVLLEEVAFRGVLLGMLLRRASTVAAVAASSALFGLWHVLPSLGIADVNPVLADTFTGPAGTVVAVSLAVVGTAVAGVVFCVLRLVGRSLVTPVLAHVATNSVGFALSWFVIRAG